MALGSGTNEPVNHNGLFTRESESSRGCSRGPVENIYVHDRNPFGPFRNRESGARRGIAESLWNRREKRTPGQSPGRAFVLTESCGRVRETEVGSGGRIRTCDQVVNSHLRYHCATPERLAGSPRAAGEGMTVARLAHLPRRCQQCHAQRKKSASAAPALPHAQRAAQEVSHSVVAGRS